MQEDKKDQDNTPQTLGEERVRVDFNPGGNLEVQEIKRRTADLINYTESVCKFGTAKKRRLCNLAMTAFEEGAMWAVKMATFGQDKEQPQVSTPEKTEIDTPDATSSKSSTGALSSEAGLY